MIKSSNATSLGVANLFMVLVQQADIDCVRISGYARQGELHSMDHKIDSEWPIHHWNAFLIDNVWHLCDPTLGAGYRKDTRFVKDFSEAYFTLQPEEFAIGHFPLHVHAAPLPAPCKLSSMRWPYLSPPDPPTLPDLVLPPIPQPLPPADADASQQPESHLRSSPTGGSPKGSTDGSGTRESSARSATDNPCAEHSGEDADDDERSGSVTEADKEAHARLEQERALYFHRRAQLRYLYRREMLTPFISKPELTQFLEKPITLVRYTHTHYTLTS